MPVDITAAREALASSRQCTVGPDDSHEGPYGAPGKVDGLHLESALLRVKELEHDLECARRAHERALSRENEAAVSGAALAARVATGDPSAARALTQAVKSIRDPRAVLDRIMDSLSEPLPCGHPLECIPDHEPEDAADVRCGWCIVIEENRELRERLETLSSAR